MVGEVDEVVEKVEEGVDEVDEVVVGLIEPSSPFLSSVVVSLQLADIEHFTSTCSGFAIVRQLCFAIDANQHTFHHTHIDFGS